MFQKLASALRSKLREPKRLRRFLLTFFLILFLISLSLTGIFTTIKLTPTPPFLKTQKAFAAGESWYNASWTYRKKITIDHTKVASDEANFPVLISLDSLSNINVNGTDIRFASSDGTTELPREIESYSSGSLRAWVKAPSLSSSTDTVIYMYYGNSGATEPAASSTYGSQNVWQSTGDTSTAMVQHMKDATTSTITDSTANANNGTKKAANEPIEATGKIGKGQTFDGTDDYVNARNGASLSITNAITVGAWVNTNSTSSLRTGIVEKMNISSPYNGMELGILNGNPYFHAGGTYGSNVLDGTKLINDSTWHQITGTFGTQVMEIHANNAPAPSISNAGYIGENIAYDSNTNKYWWAIEDTTINPVVIRLASADNINGPWTVEATPVLSSATLTYDSPHLVKFGGYWYIYYTVYASGLLGEIHVQKSTSVNTGYSEAGISNPILKGGTSGQWDDNRASEEYVFEDNGTYYMFYMGESVAGLFEKTGYATSSTPIGPFTKYAGNPVLSGSSFSGNWDSGQDRAADPYVFKKDGVFYVGVTASVTGKSGWQDGIFKTTDFSNYTPVYVNPVLMRSAQPAWDSEEILKGAVTEAGGVYYLTYTGRNTLNERRVGLTTLQFNSVEENISSLYIDGSLDNIRIATNNISNNSQNLTIGKKYDSTVYFPGSIDEVRISNSVRSADWIATEYNNQSSSSTFYALSSEEPLVLDHLTITGTGTMTAGSSQIITITAKTNLGATYTSYSGDKSLTFSGANAYSGGSSPTCSDKTGADIPFGTATTVTFTSGVATCTLKLYKVESATITATDGTYNANSNSLAVTVTDTTAPTGGSITYTDGDHTTATVSLTTSDGTDSGSGINTSTRTVQRKSATLSNETCGSYGSFTTITPTGTYPDFIDSTVVFGNCYQYQYLVSDNAGNQAAYTSLNVAKVTPPGPATTVTDHSATAQTCGNTPPSSAPSLYAASSQDSSSVILYFTDAGDPVNSYAVEYGTSPGSYQYSALSIGTKGTRTYLVASLLPATTYYFRVRGGNGCAIGTWSNEISAKTKGIVSFNQLDITQSELESKPVEKTPPTTASCKTYTVKSGDNLWSIAENLLGDGNRYKEIIKQNKDKYPSLETSNNLEAGWKLKVNCGKDNKQNAQGPASAEATAGEGYDVKIKVVDTNKKPVQGAKVTIHSKVQETVTNKDGIAQFKNVEAGDHKVLIAYNNFEGEQSVNLTGNVKEFDLNVTVQQKAISLSPLAYGIIGIMGLVVIVLAVLLIKSKRKV